MCVCACSLTNWGALEVKSVWTVVLSALLRDPREMCVLCCTHTQHGGQRIKLCNHTRTDAYQQAPSHLCSRAPGPCGRPLPAPAHSWVLHNGIAGCLQRETRFYCDVYFNTRSVYRVLAGLDPELRSSPRKMLAWCSAEGSQGRKPFPSLGRCPFA